MPPNPKKKSPAGHISDNTPRDWSLVDILEEKNGENRPKGENFLGVFLDRNRPKGEFLEH